MGTWLKGCEASTYNMHNPLGLSYMTFQVRKRVKSWQRRSANLCRTTGRAGTTGRAHQRTKRVEEYVTSKSRQIDRK